MLDNLRRHEKVIMDDGEIKKVYRVEKTEKYNKEIYGISFDPECLGNFSWFWGDGTPFTYWVRTKTSKSIVRVLQNEKEDVSA